MTTNRKKLTPEDVFAIWTVAAQILSHPSDDGENEVDEWYQALGEASAIVFGVQLRLKEESIPAGSAKLGWNDGEFGDEPDAPELVGYYVE